MYLKKIKLGNIFLILAVLYFLGYTHFLGGPYGIAKFFFVLILISAIIFGFFIFWSLSFIKNTFNKKNKFNSKMQKENNETIKVDAKIIE